ncbi:MAG: DNA mismatch repair protein MutT [Chloroflexi bacterium]|nr:DNA mismatch repair protein MutT [Chloroflexota bacterium]|tara:strand:+ start:18 stop:401 length:384 start_codon:yes stop_codon:yes gene_type:complete
MWSDPKVAVGAIIPYKSGIILVQRAIEPGLGKWTFPSGYVNRGEVVEEALRRELLEECDIKCEIVKLVGIYSEENNPVIFIVYEAKIISGEPKKNDDENYDIMIADFDNLPDLAFNHDKDIILSWKN